MSIFRRIGLTTACLSVACSSASPSATGDVSGDITTATNAAGANSSAGKSDGGLLPPSRLDHPLATQSAAAAFCYDGDNYCDDSTDQCIACCNATWYDINYCVYGVNFYCNGVHYNAYNCWPIGAPSQ
jgi:hypothetical protein